MPRFCVNTSLFYFFSMFLRIKEMSTVNNASQLSLKRTCVPYCLSNFIHQAQQSPSSPSLFSLPSRSLPFILTARLNQSLAFSTLPSAQKTRATLQTTSASSLAFLRASTPRAFRAGRGSAQMDRDNKIPEEGHSCKPYNEDCVNADTLVKIMQSHLLLTALLLD
jgi:hypothetical protein